MRFMILTALVIVGVAASTYLVVSNWVGTPESNNHPGYVVFGAEMILLFSVAWLWSLYALTGKRDAR